MSHVSYQQKPSSAARDLETGYPFSLCPARGQTATTEVSHATNHETPKHPVYHSDESWYGPEMAFGAERGCSKGQMPFPLQPGGAHLDRSKPKGTCSMPPPQDQNENHAGESNLFLPKSVLLYLSS